MSQVMQKNLLVMMVLGFILATAMLFVSPDVAHASDPNAVDVTVSDRGGLSITGGGFTDGGSAGAWNDFIQKYKNFIVGIAGIGAVTMIVLFIFQFLRLGASSGNPQARNQALVGLLWTGVAAAGLGAVTIFVGFFYNAFG